MTLNYAIKAEICITMYDYIGGILEVASNISRSGIGFATSTPSNLYDIRPDYNKVKEYFGKKERDQYHTITS